MSTPITKTSLIKAGYKEFPAPPIFNRYSIALFEKKITDDKGLKYFIHVNVYDYSEFGRGNLSFDFEVQFTTLKGDNVNVQNLANCSIEEHEAFFEEVWNSVKSITYRDGFIDEDEPQVSAQYGIPFGTRNELTTGYIVPSLELGENL